MVSAVVAAVSTESTQPIKVSSSSVVIPTQRRYRCPTQCSVCSRVCQYFFYGVASCDGCKHFFRRAVVFGRVNFVCKRISRCDVANGAKCKSCRLDQCILAGMNFYQVRDGVDDKIFEKLEERRRRLMARRLEEEGRRAETSKDLALVKQLTSIDCTDAHLMRYFLQVEKCARKIRWSATPIPERHYQEGCASLANLLARTENVLTENGNFSTDLPQPMSQTEICELREKGTFIRRPAYLAMILLFVVEVAKTMPFFHRLDMRDKTCLITRIAMPMVAFSWGYYSYRENSKTVVQPSGYAPVVFFTSDRYRNDKVISNLVTRVMTNVMEPFHRVHLSDEEFVLVRALIYAHMVSTGLSDASQRLLLAEAEKYSAMLMAHLQARHGPSPGALKFAQAMQLVEFCFNTGHHHVQFLNYLSSHYDRDSFLATMPPALVQLCTSGGSQLPELVEL